MKNTTLGFHFIQNIIAELKKLKELCERAAARLNENDYHWKPDDESNSIAVLMKHMAGNMISRWTDFLTADGEKPERNRDGEFIDDFKTISELTTHWEKGWKCLFDALNSLNEDDLLRTVYIRQKPLSVVEAINRQFSHYAYHTGQIVFIAKQIKSGNWKTLSVPKRKL